MTQCREKNLQYDGLPGLSIDRFMPHAEDIATVEGLVRKGHDKDRVMYRALKGQGHC